ncbi:MAG: hypothetical protein WD824_26895 [Cyclobacteriaceae bacterium]
MRLFSYSIAIDDGAAPNPFWGKCTLAISKPVLRRVIEKGDWVAAVGSRVGELDYSGKLVYVMKITEKMNHQKYHRYCKMMLNEKIPDVGHDDYRRRVGDCIYDFDENSKGRLIRSVHTEANREFDLGILNDVLLSDHFYYFGMQAVDIPDKFKTLIIEGSGPKSIKNQPVKNEFIAWIDKTFEKNKLYGDPQIEFYFDNPDEWIENYSLMRAVSDRADEDYSYSNDRLPLSHWNYFLALESDLKGVSRHIEIHKANYKTFSISLTQLFMASCSEIDVILKEVAKLTTLRKAKNIYDFFEVLSEKVPLIFSKKVSIPLYQIELIPFEHWKSDQPPVWWTAYNNVKHHRNTHYSDANLENCLNALGALYIVIYELILLYKGKSDREYSGNLIYEHLQPQQELFRLEGEDLWRDAAEGRTDLFGRRR